MKLELMPVQLLSSSSGCPKIPRSASLTPPCSVYSLNREKAFTPWTLLFIQCLTPSALRRRPLTCCDCDILLQAQSCSPIGSKLQDGQEEVVLLAPSAVTARASNWLKFEVGKKVGFDFFFYFSDCRLSQTRVGAKMETNTSSGQLSAPGCANDAAALRSANWLDRDE